VTEIILKESIHLFYKVLNKIINESDNKFSKIKKLIDELKYLFSEFNNRARARFQINQL
jgi:hypothetical protein